MAYTLPSSVRGCDVGAIVIRCYVEICSQISEIALSEDTHSQKKCESLQGGI